MRDIALCAAALVQWGSLQDAAAMADAALARRTVKNRSEVFKTQTFRRINTQSFQPFRLGCFASVFMPLALTAPLGVGSKKLPTTSCKRSVKDCSILPGISVHQCSQPEERWARPSSESQPRWRHSVSRRAARATAPEHAERARGRSFERVSPPSTSAV